MIQRFYMNFSLKSIDQGIPLIFPQFYFNLQDLSVIFNGQDCFAYDHKEDAEIQKTAEEEFYTMQRKKVAKEEAPYVLT